MSNCPICRDLQPVDCPGCGEVPGEGYHGFGTVDFPCSFNKTVCCPDDETCCQMPGGEHDREKRPVTNVNGRSWIDRLNAKTMAGDVHNELFRDIGEPWLGFTSDYPDQYGYYPGCNES